MNSDERNHFWDTLKRLSNRSEIGVLNQTIRLPRKLCRFRSVKKENLINLQNNIMMFSTPAHFDDPFDTYFYLDRDRLSKLLERLSQNKGITNEVFIRNAIDFLSIPEPEKKILQDGVAAFGQKGLHPLSIDDITDELKKMEKDIRDKLYSICFCDDPLNEALWVKYADGHRGFVQIYDMTTAKYDLCEDEKYRHVAEKQNRASFLSLYPVHYSDERPDATGFLIATLIRNAIPEELYRLDTRLTEIVDSAICWDTERISLNKKACHEADAEWRMVYPGYTLGRPYIRMRPSAIALGLDMEDYERLLVMAAAKSAGINSIYEMFIDSQDELAMRPVQAM